MKSIIGRFLVQKGFEATFQIISLFDNRSRSSLRFMLFERLLVSPTVAAPSMAEFGIEVVIGTNFSKQLLWECGRHGITCLQVSDEAEAELRLQLSHPYDFASINYETGELTINDEGHLVGVFPFARYELQTVPYELPPEH